ncbi:DUF2179 domain-containing protein [Natranaerobius trueperi]|uniref:UPF0316 protein CDO51_08050 n=1 Tax=Natranaerobius trueperi TaxID=759412 RepID=A0A226BX17_9FIRM|nr:DUF2179 domain-containing protein [Natranaerobius trueperi]OWZ83546.1 hypothetical protein CDO51_08050 [Natranaerobius trueperi]
MEMVLIILIINVVYVSLSTIRMLFTLKGQRYSAAVISSFETFIYVLGLGLVLDNLDEIQNLFAYAGGFALGVVVGTKIEEKLALGYITVKVISKYTDYSFSEMLREKGYGVTEWIANGRDGERLVMEILTSRKDQKELYNNVIAFDPEAFVISYDPQHFRGGFWVSNLRKQAKRRGEQYEYPQEDNLPGVDEEVIEEIKSEEDFSKYKEETLESEESNNNYN